MAPFMPFDHEMDQAYSKTPNAHMAHGEVHQDTVIRRILVKATIKH